MNPKKATKQEIKALNHGYLQQTAQKIFKAQKFEFCCFFIFIYKSRRRIA